MEPKASTEKVYVLSEDIVAREIQGEFVIIPITSGIADLEDAIFSLNETGQAIWHRLNGKKSLEDLAHELESEFEAPEAEIKKDVLGLAEELLKRKMLVEVK